MVPSNGWTLLLFLLLVCPGLRFELLAQRRFARPDESVFIEISRVLLAAVFFAIGAAGIVAVANQIFWDVTLADLVNKGSFVRDHPGTALSLVAAQLVVSFVLVEVHANVVRRYNGYGRRLRAPKNSDVKPRSIELVHAWTNAFRQQAPKSKATRIHTYVRVRMTDEREYFGVVESFTAGPDAPKRELVLAQPIHTAGPGNEPMLLPPEYQRLILRDELIHSIAVAYYDDSVLFPAANCPDGT